jgi:hypothetical protein
MGNRWFAACAFGLLASAAWAESGLTDTETRWLQLSGPAIRYAREQRQPLDIEVQPQATPGNAPLAMAYVAGRCKLVLSMRDNPEAQRSIEEIPPALLQPVVEAMAAHELGHCWRYVRGAWHTLPAGFAAAPGPLPANAASAEDLQEMQLTRLEEGFADLVGLAWTLQHHPQHYAQVHAWFVSFRSDDEHPGSHHDTLAWVRLVPEPSAFPAADTPFAQAWPLWQQGLRAAD